MQKVRDLGIVDFDRPPVPTLDELLAERAGDPDLVRDVEAVCGYIGDCLAPNTRAAYARAVLDWAAFVTENNLPPGLPANIGGVMLWIRSLAARPDCNPRTIAGLLSGLNKAHELNGYLRPGDNAEVKALMKGLRHRHRKPLRQKSGLVLEDLRLVLDAFEDRDACSDVALLTLARTGMSPTALSHLTTSDVTVDERGLTVRMQASGRWCQGRVETRTVGRTGDPACPVAAVDRLLAHLQGQGPLFRHTDGDEAMSGFTPQGLARRLRILATKTGLQPSLESCSDADFRSCVELVAEPPLIDVRDAALLTVGFAGALRAMDLQIATWDNVRFEEERVTLRLPWSKTDQDGRGALVPLPLRTGATKPGLALLRWRQRLSQELGQDPSAGTPLFPALHSSGRSLKTRRPLQPMSRSDIAEIVRRRVAAAGLAGDFATHSLRSGCVTSAIDARATVPEICALARMCPEMVMRYDRGNQRASDAQERMGL